MQHLSSGCFRCESTERRAEVCRDDCVLDALSTRPGRPADSVAAEIPQMGFPGKKCWSWLGVGEVGSSTAFEEERDDTKPEGKASAAAESG